MDGERFDALTRVLASKSSRRTGLAALFMGLMAPWTSARSVMSAKQEPPPIEPIDSTETEAGDTAQSTSSEISFYALGDSIAAGHGLDDEDGPNPDEAPTSVSPVCRDCDSDSCKGCNAEACLACQDSNSCQEQCADALKCRPCCRRSSRYSYPARIVDLLSDGNTSVFFTHVACTGASALPELIQNEIESPIPTEGLLSDYRNPLRLLRHQVDAVVGDLSFVPPERPTLVSITIGANDFEFARGIELLVHLYGDDKDAFEAWVTKRAEDTGAELSKQLDRLLAFPNVVVVVTEVYNPFNTSSIFYLDPIICALRSCRQRIDDALTALNEQLVAAVELAKGSDHANAAQRVAVAKIHDGFKGHESPRSTCGDAAPDVGSRQPGEEWRSKGTWIQHRSDPESNSYAVPRLGQMGVLLKDALSGTDLVTIRQRVDRLLAAEWRGDCFHPNRDGARYIARQVVDVARPLLDAISEMASPPVIVVGPTVTEWTETTAVVEWETDQPTVGIVEYGLKPGLGRTRPKSPDASTTSHRVELDNLEPGTTYYWRVRSSTSSAFVESDVETFVTESGCASTAEACSSDADCCVDAPICWGGACSPFLCDADPNCGERCEGRVAADGSCTCIAFQSAMECPGFQCATSADCDTDQVCVLSPCDGEFGRCRTVCPDDQSQGGNCPGVVCDDGSCCMGETACCGGTCVGLLTDPYNCGDCGIVCDGACESGLCAEAGNTCGGNQEPCATDADCCSGYLCFNFIGTSCQTLCETDEDCPDGERCCGARDGVPFCFAACEGI